MRKSKALYAMSRDLVDRLKIRHIRKTEGTDQSQTSNFLTNERKSVLRLKSALFFGPLDRATLNFTTIKA